MKHHRPTTIGVLGLVCALALVLEAPAVTAGPDEVCSIRRVPRDELARAMRQHGDYDILATTNRGRFTSELLLLLVREAREQAGGFRPLYIDSEDWFYSYIETAGVTADEAPESAVLGMEHGQRLLLEFRPGRVVNVVRRGPTPRLALNVRAWWPEDAHPDDKYSFTDTTSTPKLKVTTHREITYRLLEFEDMVVIDKMDGVTGRPLTGFLGKLFDVIGEGSLKYSRSTVTADGLHVIRARSKKILSVSATVIVRPDGVATKGVPDDRPDLEEIEERLKRDLEIDYVPYAWETEDGTCPADAAEAGGS
jgi:hypothetical protein